MAPVVDAIAELCKKSSRAGADETGGRVSGKLHWIHVCATQTLTHIAAHAKRGRQAFDDIGILAVFNGVLTHDGWGAYKSLACKHSLCNAHHARELAFVHEEMGQAWAGGLRDLLMAACVRTVEGLEIFCRLRSFFNTMRKQGRSGFESLLNLFEGIEPQPLAA